MRSKTRCAVSSSVRSGGTRFGPGLLGLFVSPLLLYLLSILVLWIVNLELSMDLELSDRGKIEMRGLHPRRTVLSLGVLAWIIAAQVRPRLLAWRRKRLWGN